MAKILVLALTCVQGFEYDYDWPVKNAIVICQWGWKEIWNGNLLTL